MTKKWQILAATIVVLVVIGAASVYMTQPQAPTPSPTPTVSPTPTPTTTPSTSPTPTTAPTPSPPPTVSPEEQVVRDVVKAYFDALNKQSLPDLTSLFTKDAVYPIYDKNYTGVAEIEKVFKEAFAMDPTMRFNLLNISDVKMSTETAEAKGFRIRTGKMPDVGVNYAYDHLFMIKEDGKWKIKKALVTYYSEIVAPSLTNAVTVDGKWTTPDEWKDAVEVPMRYSIWGDHNANGTAHLRVKHDESYLYLLVDYVSDTTPQSPGIGYWWEGVTVCFDPEQNGGWKPQSDDYLYNIGVSTGQQYKAKVGVSGGKWNWPSQTDTSELIQKSIVFSSNATNDPYSTVKHSIYEFKMPLPDKKVFGFFVGAADHGGKSYMTWPSDAWDQAPNTWGILKLK
jgi:ketosteroid isomerase-like protein